MLLLKWNIYASIVMVCCNGTVVMHIDVYIYIVSV